MRLEHYPLQQLQKEIKSIVGKYIDLHTHELFFFGSRVSGKGNAHSDIDIGIEGKEPIPPKAMREIKEALMHLPTLYTIEIVDFKNTSADFVRVAKQHIKKIV